MLINETILINISNRNIAFVYEEGISECGLYQFNSYEAFELGLSHKYRAVCDICQSEYRLKRYCFEYVKFPYEMVSLCPRCREEAGRERMRETVRTPEHRLFRSQISKQAYKDHPESFKRVQEKRKLWLNSDEGKEVARRNLPHRSGEDHPRWNPNKSEYLLYRNEVKLYENKWDLFLLKDYDPNKRSLCGVDGGFQLDHIFPIKEAYEISADPYYIGHICNLQFIPWEENRNKSCNITITYEQLKQIVHKFDSCVIIED